jgi:hypothetical protein
MLRLARPSRRALAVLAPVALAAVAIPSVAMAAGGSTPHVFNACVDETGYVWETVMDADPGCADLQAFLAAPGDGSAAINVTLTPVAWNQIGQNGQPGIAGRNGVSGYVTVTKSLSVAKHKTATLSLACPTGKKVTGGGVNPTSNSIDVLATYPASNNAGWAARLLNDSGSKHDVKIYAICATA